MNVLVLLRLSDDYIEDELNPLIIANAIRQSYENVNIDCLTMDRNEAIKRIERCSDYPIRNFYLLSDEKFAGADTFLTATIISRFLMKYKYDIVIGNYKSRFGETAHVPVSIASILNIPFASNVVSISVGESLSCVQRLDYFNEVINMKSPCVITCSNILSDDLVFLGMPNMFNVKENMPDIHIINAEEIRFEKNEKINVFSQVVQADRIQSRHKERQEVFDVDMARKVLSENINIY
ncbi:MAG: hypothetical protein IKS48_06730 [Eubacterium sp.]|nr:hypothetical protein [Eubacterium sp.]